MLIPVKAFHTAKARLSPTVTATDRAALARWMAGRVVEAVRPLPTFVACDDDAVAAWAESLGATVLWGPRLGLNGAVDSGVETIAGKGFDDVIISHGDLPIPRALPALARPGAIVIVPDRRLDGTNVIVRPCRDRPPRDVRPGLVPPPSRTSPHVGSPGDGAARHRAVARPRHGRRSDPPADPPARLGRARHAHDLWDDLWHDRWDDRRR